MSDTEEPEMLRLRTWYNLLKVPLEIIWKPRHISDLGYWILQSSVFASSEKKIFFYWYWKIYLLSYENIDKVDSREVYIFLYIFLPSILYLFYSVWDIKKGGENLFLLQFLTNSTIQYEDRHGKGMFLSFKQNSKTLPYCWRFLAHVIHCWFHPHQRRRGPTSIEDSLFRWEKWEKYSLTPDSLISLRQP